MTSARPSLSRQGFTFVEIAVVLVIMSVAVAIFASTVTAGSQLRAVIRERSIAAEACRAILESMRNEDFSEVFALYNTHPGDDPGGPGTAPGATFAVRGLSARPGAPGGVPGEVRFPTSEEFNTVALVGAQRIKALAEQQGMGGPPPVPSWALRENVDVPRLGMQRDLNGDSIIDGDNHATDYILLPVEVRVRWTGRCGDLEFAVCTMLTEFRKL